MTLISDNETAATAIGRGTVGRPSKSTRRGRALTRWSGGLLVICGHALWLAWLSWRISHLTVSAFGFAVIVLEFVAFAAGLVVSAGLWVGRPAARRSRRSEDRHRPMPLLLAEALDLGEIVHETSVRAPIGEDDTGEIAWARRGIRVLDDQRRNARAEYSGLNLREATWSVVALDGLRRLLSVAVLIGILFTGSAPFELPPTSTLVALGAGVGTLSIGHWLISRGFVRPGSRLLWSMASIGAGLGDGVSRSGLPIRWVMTMATLVALNISVALRGISDRWTHGLGPMQHDARVAAMSLAFALVGTGIIALSRMPSPDLDFYGATRRLEERSVRRLALGLTLIVALIGFVAGVMPADPVVAAP